MHGVTRIDITEEIALITFRKIPCSLPLLSEIFGRFGQEGINIDMISQTSPAGEFVTTSFSCRESDMVKVLQIARELQEKHTGVKPMVSNGNCKIQLFGEEMRTASGVFAQALSALENTAVEVQQITTSEVDISLLVKAMHLDDAVAALKKSFGI